jgi:hypothetical protein
MGGCATDVTTDPYIDLQFQPISTYGRFAYLALNSSSTTLREPYFKQLQHYTH